MEVRNKYNIIVGWRRDAGNVINAFHIKYGLVGWYNKNADITFDKAGKIYCYGDGTHSLILQQEDK